MKYLRFLEAWLLCLFFKPKKDINKIKLVITSLEEKLNNIVNIENKVNAIIELLKEISQIEDSDIFEITIRILKAKNYGQLGHEIGLLLEIQKVLKQAGHFSHFNQSKKGELVTPEKVYLGGGDSGIWTKQASYWLAKQDLYQTYLKEEDSRDSETIWDCIHKQASDFVSSYTCELLSKLDDFKKGSQQ